MRDSDDQKWNVSVMHAEFWSSFDFVEHTIYIHMQISIPKVFVLYIVERVVRYVGKVLRINWKEDLILQRNHEKKNKLWTMYGAVDRTNRWFVY
jgi:hypothetical protein